MEGQIVTVRGELQQRPGRGRRIEHHLTSSGERVLEAGHKVADEVLARCYTALTDADRATLLALLQRLIVEDA
ncbi:hypothetical protein [Microbispora rosea]|uniref:hypothetical protein n=1 Tax=Microbispora rosea TaxID=58117 RepID=UPI003D90E060